MRHTSIPLKTRVLTLDLGGISLSPLRMFIKSWLTGATRINNNAKSSQLKSLNHTELFTPPIYFMFIDVEHKFNDAKHKFNVDEHKLLVGLR